jgi:hypothetical protein
MARITRSSILLWMQDVLGIQAATGNVPLETANVIQPVVEVGPKVSKVLKIASATTSSNSTLIYTTPTDKDFYLTGAVLSHSKDATSDNTLVGILVFVDGLQARVLFRELQTTTAGNSTDVMNLSFPLKLDRGSRIDLAGTFTAGTMSKRASITGFIVE